MSQIIIYTDGACSGNPGPGGWGYIVIDSEGLEDRQYGHEKYTTNNRMEMMAVIKALMTLELSSDIKLHTDSQYVIKGITEWVKGWKARGWKTASKAPVKNVDLWMLIDELNQMHKIQWVWVKGHAGDKYNELADALACAGAEEARRK